MKKQKELFEPDAGTVNHVCIICGASWECSSRSCWQEEKTTCGKCPCALPECGLMEKKSV